MRTSVQVAELFAALSEAQGEMDGAKKTSKNPFFKSTYADLEAVVEALKGPFKRNGLAFIQSASGTNLITMITHKSGQWFETDYPLSYKDITDPQKVGGANTYARRYALKAAVGIPEVDDDGNVASDLDAPMQDLKQANAHQVSANPQPVGPGIASLEKHVNARRPDEAPAAKFTVPASVKARADAAPKAPAPLFPKVVEGSSDMGSYIIKFGTHKGKMLSELEIFKLDGYIKYLHAQAKKDNKPLSGPAAELCEIGETFLKSRLASTENPKWTNDEPPMPSDNDEIPF